MHVVYVHDAKIRKENGFTLQFCSNYPSKMSRTDAMYVFLTNYNTFPDPFHLIKEYSTHTKKKSEALIMHKKTNVYKTNTCNLAL